MMPRNDDEREALKLAWNSAEPAEEFKPLPPGRYVARIIKGEFFKTKNKGTPGYRLTLVIIEGEFAGRRCWKEIWLTKNAMRFAKPELAKLGLTDLQQLYRPLREGIVCRINLAIESDDGGTERNKIVAFDVLPINPSEPGAFAADDAESSEDGEGM